jgi:hypothetical protein
MTPSSAELIGLCEEILDDAELTVEEVRSLGAWLGIHEEARHEWPASEIAPVVQQALADDKVTTTEMKLIASRLRRVLKEHGRQRAAAAEMAAHERTAEALASFDASRPDLPAIPVSLKIRSQTQGGVLYDVDLSGPSCSCPDWTIYRARLPKGSPSRCCKHVISAFEQLRPPHGWPAWLAGFFAFGWRTHPNRRWFLLGDSLCSVGGNDWCEVFAKEDDEWARFGYSIPEQRWSYGNEPRAAQRYERALLREVAPSRTVDVRAPVAQRSSATRPPKRPVPPARQPRRAGCVTALLVMVAVLIAAGLLR